MKTNNYYRDHPSTVKKRFVSVSIVMMVSPVFVVLFLRPDTHSILELMGIRSMGLMPAIVLPLLLTATLFIGPLSMQVVNGEIKVYTQPSYWAENIQNILWIRNHIIAPLSEEFTFRACMMPLLLHSFETTTAILLTPLFFGLAHLHHIVERHRDGMALSVIAIVSGVQFAYTSVFGIYSAYLFARTGHFVAPLIAHAFCNHMGFPDFQELLSKPPGQKYTLMVFFVLGLVSWIWLLPILTRPELYANDIYTSNKTLTLS